ncbi:MAG: hydrogenase maturation protease [Eggerthellaceae bacterium]|nr:hydrogenase maturation protease [Eggerthellaceae bacterium]
MTLEAPSPSEKKSIAVICVGNRLLRDDGLAPAVYDDLMAHYQFPDNVALVDAGCMSMDMLHFIDECDVVISVDALEDTGHPAGTVFRFDPFDIKASGPIKQSLHDLRLGDLMEAATLLGYSTQGICYGMQAEDVNPSQVSVGLTPKVQENLPILRDNILAELLRHGVEIKNSDGSPFEPPVS